MHLTDAPVERCTLVVETAPAATVYIDDKAPEIVLV